MRRLLPPTHLLRAFLTVAEHGSVARAAEALHLTPSAVSKQIAELEKWLGVPLFERLRKRLDLTSGAEAYRAALLPTLQQLEAATLTAMRSSGDPQTLHIAALSGVRQKWLDPLLADFHAQQPKIDLRFPHLGQNDVMAPATLLDGLLCYQKQIGEHALFTRRDYLIGKEVVLIAPPPLLRKKPLRVRSDVAQHLLIHHAMEPEGWTLWCRMHEVQGVDTHAGPQLTLVRSIVNAVSSGVGLALMPLLLVQDEIADGAVDAPFPADEHEEGGYYFCSRAPDARNPALEVFRSWLIEAAAAARHGLPPTIE